MKSVDENNNRCLKGCTDNPFCPPKHFVKAAAPNSIDVLFVDYDTMTACPYAKAFGYGHYCNSAERVEFYKKNGK